MNNFKYTAIALVFATLIGSTGISQAAPSLRAVVQNSKLVFEGSMGDVLQATLRIIGPNGFLLEKSFIGTLPIVETAASPRFADGQYRYEVTVRQNMPSSLQAEFDAAVLRSDGAGAGIGNDLGRRVAEYSAAASGSFRILNGSLLLAPVVSASGQRRDSTGGSAQMDQVIPDDLIVQSSLCVGFDCVNGESFGFDTLRLKENNTRIKFEDTSASVGFPTHDWQLTANDSASGGAEKFSIEDITAGTIPFTITGSAPNNSIFIDSTGRVGFRTSTPVLDLHVSTSNTPAFRMEQTSAGGFTAQTWDVAGNEANFFVRDVTGGSRLPFRIRPGAPTSSVDISASGNVGIGTASPIQPLHVQRSNGTALLFVEETSVSAGARNLLVLTNAGGDPNLRMSNRSGGNTTSWFLTAGLTDFRVTNSAGTNQMLLSNGGNMTIAGTLTQGSSREIKDNLMLADPTSILKAIGSLPLYRWNYKNTDAGDRHLGPTAEDFHARFQLGTDNKHIAPSDIASVALAAVKALTLQVAARDGELSKLRKQVKQLERLVKAKNTSN